MPYIDNDFRKDLEPTLQTLVNNIHDTVEYTELDGVLNYVISRIVSKCLKRNTPWRYKTIARALAVFEAAKLEFYVRVAVPYEQKARDKNGDIPEYE